jgi:aspartate aminotransferase
VKAEATQIEAMSVLPFLADREQSERALSALARELIGSEILSIAAQIRAKVAAGESILNFTVGDYSPKEFPIPQTLLRAIKEALDAGHTNYPPSDGVLELRKAVVRHYQRKLFLDYPLESCVIAGGARPAIYAAYRAVVNPGERVIYPIPSWNNNHYCHLSPAIGVEVLTRPENHFLPSADQIAPHLKNAQMLCLNSPLNPSGTMFTRDQLLDIIEAVAEENRRRTKTLKRPVIVLYDHVYWMLTFGERMHHTPVELVPESAGWTVFVDSISKGLAATGLRVGWAIGPPPIISRMADLIGHMGAWAPRAEQIATARLLESEDELDAFEVSMRQSLQSRLEDLHAAFERMRENRFPVRSLSPEGGIYLSAQIALKGYQSSGRILDTNDSIRRYLLEAAGIAVVPFQAFGYPNEDGWFRLSVGAVSKDQVRAVLPRLTKALDALEPPR